MRAKKLSTVAAAAAMLALAPASALAVHGHRSPTGCRVTVYAEPRLVTSGDAPELFGAVICPGHPAAAASQKVTIYEHTAGTPGFKVLGETTTESGGGYKFPAGTLTTDTTFYAGAGGALSGMRLVKVAPLVTVTAVGEPEGADLKTGFPNRVTFTGTVSPADNGAEVALERESATGSEEWAVIDKSIAHGGPISSTYTIVHTFGLPGDANLRVIVRPHRKFDVRGVSNTLSFEISQPQNPRLTINSSADPVTYGQPVTISGVLAGAGAGQKVTLFSHPVHTPGFTKVTETATEAAGAYKFAIPAATSSALYRVTGGNVKSTVLFEGVRYSLLAGGPSGTVMADTPQTFTFTIAPAPGLTEVRPVYLERQNPAGGGYHPVTVDFLAAGMATGQIVWYPHGSGTQVYRIHVPGNPGNQGAYSAPFTINVTPAPADLLKPTPQPTLPH